MLQFNQIDTTTTEGRYLLSAISLLTIDPQSIGPDNVMAKLDEIAFKVYGRQDGQETAPSKPHKAWDIDFGGTIEIYADSRADAVDAFMVFKEKCKTINANIRATIFAEHGEDIQDVLGMCAISGLPVFSDDDWLHDSAGYFWLKPKAIEQLSEELQPEHNILSSREWFKQFIDLVADKTGYMPYAFEDVKHYWEDGMSPEAAKDNEECDEA